MHNEKIDGDITIKEFILYKIKNYSEEDQVKLIYLIIGELEKTNIV